MDNRIIADKLTGFAHYLQSRRKNLYRVKAYRRAAETVLGLAEPVEAIIARDGRKGLEILPGIGRHLSFTIVNLVETGLVRPLRRKSRSPRPIELGLCRVIGAAPATHAADFLSQSA